MRCFIAVDIPKEIKKEILKIQAFLPKFLGKLTEPENLHLTLKFLGELTEEEIRKVKANLKKINLDKFNVEISHLGVFSEKSIRIIWLNLFNCSNLQKKIDYVLKDFFPQEKRFMGHLTIARIKSLKNKQDFLEKLKGIKIPKMIFSLEKFSLKNSILTKSGPVYSNIEVYNLS